MDVAATNPNISAAAEVHSIGIHFQSNLPQQPVSRNNVVFCPKKFVPAQKKDDIIESKVVLEGTNISNNDKIKPKWSPGVTSMENDPKYKKIQPIFQKPKSPHKIT